MSKGKSKRATILDIAREADVSPATVSRVLSDSGYPVKEELCARVRKAAQKLNYKPNIFSQMLKGVASKEIGIIVPDLLNPFYAQLVSVAARKCVLNGYAPIVCSSYDSPEMERRQLDILLRQQVAGLLFSSIDQSGAFLKELEQLDAPPFILFDQVYEGFSGNSVSFDFFKGGYMAADYLIRCGHRRIAFASRVIDRSSRKLVMEGYQKALSDAGIPAEENLLLICGEKDLPEKDENLDIHNGRALASMLLECNPKPDAVMAVNDITAIGMIDSLSRQGIRVPGDVSIIGFDNIPFASMVTPALTTIFQPALKTGQCAVDLLFEHIQNPGLGPEQIVIQPELIIRQSVRKINEP